MLATGRGAVYLPYFEGRKPLNLLYLQDEAALDARLDRLAASGERAYATDRTLALSGRREELTRYGLKTAASGDGLTLYQIGREAVEYPQENP